MITPRSYLYSRRPSPSPTPPASPNPTTPAPTSTTRARAAYSSTNNPRLHQWSPVTLDVATSTEVPRSTPSTPLAGNPSPHIHNAKPTTTMATAAPRPITPSGAVKIPTKQNHRSHKPSSRSRSSPARGARQIHSPDAVPPAVAALLAITNIPPPKRRRSLRQRDGKDSRMTVDSIVPRSRVSEKDLSQEFRLDLGDDLSLASFERSPLDFLLTPPDELEEQVSLLQTDSGFASPLSTRTGSFDSLPSLGDSISASIVPSGDFPITPRGGRLRSPRRSLEPVTSPPGAQPEDPLSKITIDDRLCFGAKPAIAADKRPPVTLPFKAVFKSNLTASLRALRSAARSLSTFTTSSIPPDDLLTRSILTIEPRVPFTDERRPPVLEEEPNEAIRRYLNPTSNIRPEARGASPIRNYTASIQMQTYKVQRSRGSRTSRNTAQASNSSTTNTSTVSLFPPGPRQREMRENSDFIRIAVMEHLMRKSGKLDDQREGRARWLLPPRKIVTKPYEVGPGGVPVRWMSTMQDD